MLNKYNNKNETKDNHTLRTILVFFICLFIGLCGFLAIRLLTLHDNEYINTHAIVLLNTDSGKSRLADNGTTYTGNLVFNIYCGYE